MNAAHYWEGGAGGPKAMTPPENTVSRYIEKRKDTPDRTQKRFAGKKLNQRGAKTWNSPPTGGTQERKVLSRCREGDL